MPDSSNLGLIHIYCGNGKGKTTCGMDCAYAQPDSDFAS